MDCYTFFCSFANIILCQLVPIIVFDSCCSRDEVGIRSGFYLPCESSLVSTSDFVFLPVGLWPLTVTFKAPVLERPPNGTFPLGWIPSSFSAVTVTTVQATMMILQLPPLVGAISGTHQQSEQIAEPRFEPRSERCRQLTIRGMIPIVVITITVGSATKRSSTSSTTTEKTLLRMMTLMMMMTIIDEHFHFYR